MRLELESNAATFPLTQKDISDDLFGMSADYQTLLTKGVAAAQSGDRDQARKILSQVTAMDPSSEDAWMWLASISDYPEELLAFLNRVLAINPGNEKAMEWRMQTNSLLAKTFVQRALSARGDGDMDRSVRFLEQALAHDQNCGSAWYWKAVMADSEEEKLELYSKVLAIDPEHIDAAEGVRTIRLAQARACLREAEGCIADGDLAQARMLLDDLVDHEQADLRESALMMMAEAAGSDEERISCLRRVLDLNPGNGRAIDAIEAFERASANAAFEEAKTAAAAGNREKAIELLEDLLQNSPDRVDALLLISHLSPGLDEKVAALNKVVEIDPDNPAARSGLEFLSLTFHTDANPVDITDAPDETPEPNAVSDFVTDELPPIEEIMGASHGASETSPDIEPAPEFKAYDAADEFMPEQPVSSFDVEAPFVEPTPEFDASDAADDLSPEPPSSPFVEDQDAFHPAAAVWPQEPDVTASSVAQTTCPFCWFGNEPAAFECEQCRATLTLSDIEKLLSGTTDADQEVVNEAVTAMEAEWNIRDFSSVEFANLAIGQFNLGRADLGFRYLQEASRMDPNNVILAGQVNTIAIRLDEMRRQSEVHEALPKGKTILVVDDSPTVRKLISGKLEKSGHNVVCAVDGLDALEKLEETLPDLVLLDITMPRMDGYEVCKNIRANPVSKDIPVVMISGKDGFFDKVRGRMAGTTGYVTKPFGPETLMKALETYLVPEPVEAV